MCKPALCVRHFLSFLLCFYSTNGRILNKSVLRIAIVNCVKYYISLRLPCFCFLTLFALRYCDTYLEQTNDPPLERTYCFCFVITKCHACDEEVVRWAAICTLDRQRMRRQRLQLSEVELKRSIQHKFEESMQLYPNECSICSRITLTAPIVFLPCVKYV